MRSENSVNLVADDLQHLRNHGIKFIDEVTPGKMPTICWFDFIHISCGPAQHSQSEQEKKSKVKEKQKRRRKYLAYKSLPHSVWPQHRGNKQHFDFLLHIMQIRQTLQHKSAYNGSWWVMVSDGKWGIAVKYVALFVFRLRVWKG